MPCTASKARLCVSDGQEGQIPRQSRAGGPMQAEKPPRSGVWSFQSPSSISCQAKSLGTPHPCKSVHESSSSICPAPRDECGGLHIPPSVTAAGTDVPQSGWDREWGRLALAPCVGSRRQSRNEGTWALQGRVRIAAPGTPGWRELALSPGHSHIQPCPRPAHNPRSCCSWFSFWKKLLPNS